MSVMRSNDEQSVMGGLPITIGWRAVCKICRHGFNRKGALAVEAMLNKAR